MEDTCTTTSDAQVTASKGSNATGDAEGEIASEGSNATGDTEEKNTIKGSNATGDAEEEIASEGSNATGDTEEEIASKGSNETGDVGGSCWGSRKAIIYRDYAKLLIVLAPAGIIGVSIFSFFWSFDDSYLDLTIAPVLDCSCNISLFNITWDNETCTSVVGQNWRDTRVGGQYGPYKTQASMLMTFLIVLLLAMSCNDIFILRYAHGRVDAESLVIVRNESYTRYANGVKYVGLAVCCVLIFVVLSWTLGLAGPAITTGIPLMEWQSLDGQCDCSCYRRLRGSVVLKLIANACLEIVTVIVLLSRLYTTWKIPSFLLVKHRVDVRGLITIMDKNNGAVIPGVLTV